LISQGRGIIYAAIAGLLAMLGGITWYASLDNPQLALAEIQLTTVEVQSVNSIEGRANLEVNLLIKNPGDKTFTISNIDYELFANGKPLGKGRYSAEDIPLPGRAAFYPKAEIELPSTFQLINTDTISEEYNAIVDGQPVKFSAKGMAVVESAWSLVEKEFETSQ
jgi:LEA14-like dessication related protein